MLTTFNWHTINLESLSPLLRVALAIVLGLSILRCLYEAAVILRVVQRGRVQRPTLLIGTAMVLIAAGLLPVVVVLIKRGF